MELMEFARLTMNLEEPWEITDLCTEEGKDGMELAIHVDYPRGRTVVCPCCKEDVKVHDRVHRVWRSLDWNGTKAYLHADVPRADCPYCGVKEIDVPWADRRSRFTRMMEIFLVSLCRSMAPCTVALKFKVDPRKLRKLIAAHVKDGLKHLDLSRLERVGVDERSVLKGRSGSCFVTLFIDMDTGRVVFVTPGKDSKTLARFATFLSKHGGSPRNIKDFSCDFGRPFITGIRRYFKRSKITCDRFHLVKLATEALRKIVTGLSPIKASRLKVYYTLSTNESNMDAEQKDLLSQVRELSKRMSAAFDLKEDLAQVYRMGGRGNAKRHLEQWIAKARSSDLRPFKTLADTVEGNMYRILNWFDSGLTNGVLEGMNSLMNSVKGRSRGFRYVSSFVYMTYFMGMGEDHDVYGNVIRKYKKEALHA
ncbi:MAG: ISL3 family transposase [archaeon]|nr:ISL3 family transposase [archaeon]